MPHGLPDDDASPGARSAPLAIDLDRTSTPAFSRLSARGDLDLATVPALRERIDAVISTTTQELDLDLDGVGFCDVVSLDLLLDVQSRLTASGGRLVIRGRCRHLRRMVAALGLAGRLRIAPPADAGENGVPGPQGA